MAIESIKTVRGTSSSLTAEQVERSIRYRIKFTADEGSAAAEAAVAATFGLAVNFTPYVYNGEFDPRAILRDLRTTAGREKRVYYVDATYRSAPANQNQPGEPPVDPVNAQAFVRVSYRGFPKAIHKSFFRGFRTADGEVANPNNARMKAYRDLAVTNSAEVPINPPREITVYYPALLVTSYTLARWDQSSQAVGTVNNGPVRLTTITETGQVQFDATFADSTALVADENWTPSIVNGTPWNTIEREILFNSAGWFVDELDQGICARAQKGDPDGTGGTYSNTDILQARADGVPSVRRLLDAQGNPITDPVPLNGNGQPLNSDKPEDAIFLQWLDLTVATFQTRFGPPFYAAS